MNSMPNKEWTPVSKEQFEVILKEEIEKIPSDVLEMYKACAVGITECPCFRSEQYGIERVFVVARSAKQLILFDDVEDEFAIGEPDDDGILRDWGLCGDLIDAIRLLLNLNKKT